LATIRKALSGLPGIDPDSIEATAQTISFPIEYPHTLTGQLLPPRHPARQVTGQPHLETQDFQAQVRLFQQGLALPGVLGPDQGFQQVIQVALDPLAQHKTVVAGEPARVVTGPHPHSPAIMMPTGYNSPTRTPLDTKELSP